MKKDVENQLLGLLAAHPDGLSSPELRARLRPRPSQPTLSRRLLDLRARGLVVQVGKARATRYLLAGGRHRVSELRSQLLHREIAEKLLRKPELARRALDNLATLRRRNPAGRSYHDRWEQLLRGDRIQLLQTLSADTEEARSLRQETPFAGVLSGKERRRVLERLVP